MPTAYLDNRTITVVDGSTSPMTANIPTEAVDGTKLFIVCFNESDRNVGTIVFANGNATGLEAQGSAALKQHITMYVIDSDDVAAGTFSVPTSGAGTHVIVVHTFGDVNFASVTDFASFNTLTHNMFGPNESDSGDTDEKLWIDVHSAGKSGSFVPQDNTFDFTAAGHYLDDGDSLAGMAFYIGWQMNSEQKRGRIQSDGAWSAYHLYASNSTICQYRVYFDTQDDANWPIVEEEEEETPTPEVSSGASDADMGVSRSSGAARRRIVDPDDPRRKYNLPY